MRYTNLWNKSDVVCVGLWLCSSRVYIAVQPRSIVHCHLMLAFIVPIHHNYLLTHMSKV
jgi:hypothetical protein